MPVSTRSRARTTFGTKEFALDKAGRLIVVDGRIICTQRPANANGSIGAFRTAQILDIMAEITETADHKKDSKFIRRQSANLLYLVDLFERSKHALLCPKYIEMLVIFAEKLHDACEKHPEFRDIERAMYAKLGTPATSY